MAGTLGETQSRWKILCRESFAEKDYIEEERGWYLFVFHITNP